MQLKHTQKKTCAVTDGTCQTWFAKFRASAFLLNELHSQAEQLKLIASNPDTN